MERLGVPFPWGIVPAERILQVVRGQAPAAGAEASVVVPGGVVWLPYTFRITFSTSAVVATRQPQVTYSDGNVVFMRSRNANTFAASLNADLDYFEAAHFAGTSGATTASHGNLPVIPLLANYVIATLTAAIDAGDQYGAPILYVAEYNIRGLEGAVEKYERALAQAIAAPG